MEELLPIGSVVVLEDESTFMIIGYSPNNFNSEKQYDYILCNLTGLSKEQADLRYKKDYFYANKSDIKKILFIGYSDKDFDLFKYVYQGLLSRINNFKKENNKIEKDDLKKIFDDFIAKEKGRMQNEK